VINELFRIMTGIIRKITNIVWKMRLKEVGRNSVFDIGVKIINPGHICIGENCVINNDVYLQSCNNGKIKIGNNVTLSYSSKLLTGGIDLSKYPQYKIHFSKDISIEDNVWIGANVIILPGIKVGSNSILAAGCVVTKDVPSNVVVAGVPAKVIKTRCR
jgi:acetyltransferase-like isoleucine patch superfamily enzyme